MGTPHTPPHSPGPANGLEGFALSLELPRFLTQVEVQGIDYDDLGFRDILPIIGKQTERKLEHEMVTVSNRADYSPVLLK